MSYEKKTANEKSEKCTMQDVMFEVRELSSEQLERVTGGIELMNSVEDIQRAVLEDSH